MEDALVLGPTAEGYKINQYTSASLSHCLMLSREEQEGERKSQNVLSLAAFGSTQTF